MQIKLGKERTRKKLLYIVAKSKGTTNLEIVNVTFSSRNAAQVLVELEKLADSFSSFVWR